MSTQASSLAGEQYKNMRKFTIAFAVLASVAALAGLQAVTLKRTAKVGDVAKYKSKADVDFQGMAVSVTFLMTDKITKVDDNGNITSESTQSDMKIKMGDQEMDPPAAGDTPQVSTSKSTGEIVELKGEQVDANAYRMAAMSGFYFPEKAVSVGDSWEFKVVKNEKLGTVAGIAKYKVEKFEKVGEWDTAVLTMDYKETEGGEPASASGKIWINTKDGSMVKMDGEWKNAPFPGAPGPINAKVVIERV